MLKKIITLGLSVLLSSGALASEMVLSNNLPLQWESIISVSGSAVWSTPGQDQYLYPYDHPLYEYYTYNTNTTTAASGELFFGLQRVAFDNVIGQLGLGIAGMTDVSVTGDVDFTGVPNVYSYAYKVNNFRIDLKGKLIANYFQPVQPYVSGSIGVGFNNAHDYIPVLNNPFFTEPLWYTSHTAVAFSYTLGAGVQAMLTPHWQVGVGYQFGDLGKSFLYGDDVYLAKGLKLTHLYTNEVLFSLGYVFA